jgi:hypothetical protein
MSMQHPAPAPVQLPTAQNGLGLAAFVLGIVAMPLSLIPIFGWVFGLPVAFTGLGVGLGNLPRLRTGRAANRAQTWIGIGLSIGAILVSIGYAIIVAVGATSQP